MMLEKGSLRASAALAKRVVNLLSSYGYAVA